MKYPARIGYGINDNKKRLNKKTIVSKVKELSDEDRTAKITSCIMQSNWMKWDEVIQMDFTWNQWMYGLSANLLKFWLNSIQNTLPDPSNLRRWGRQKDADCTLCKWKNCTLKHILCGCKVAMDQGRISWRHDTILINIVRYLKQAKLQNKGKRLQKGGIKFLKEGKNPPKKKKARGTFWDGANDWKILNDTRKEQYQIPPEIAASRLRPDICIYSPSAKKVCFIELTSPDEENIKYWQIKKRMKYLNLVEEARANGYQALCKTIEVGARGYVSKVSAHTFSLMGIRGKHFTEVRKELSKVAIRCSHFIWNCKDNPNWSNPPRICGNSSTVETGTNE